MVVTAERQNLTIVRKFVQEHAVQLGMPQDLIDDLILAVDEMAANIIIHGYKGRPGNIDVHICTENDSMIVRLRDQAGLFDPTRIAEPDLTLPIEQRPIGGLGIFLARKFTDEMKYQVTAEGENELILRKKLPM